MAGLEKIVEDTAVELLRIAATELPAEYVGAMERAMEETERGNDRSPCARTPASSPSW